MALTGTAPQNDPGADPVPNFGRVAVIAGLIGFAALQLLAAVRAGWVFEYPLDDTYIHLAMASQIAHGGYGVNAGEYASAASSPLYPVLLAPFADTAFQRYLPLIWNTIGMVLTMWLWGRALVWAGYRGWQGWVMAVTVPVLSGSISVAYTGMEHTLQAAATVAITFGLARLLVERRLNAVLFIGLLFGPLFRLEDLALGSMVIFVLLAQRRYTGGVLAALLVVVPAAVFVWYLVHIGLSPLPNSVKAKLVTHEDVNLTFLQRALGTMNINLTKFGGLAIAGLSSTLLFLTAVTQTRQSRVLAWGSYALALAALAGLTYFSVELERYDRFVSGAVAALLAAGVFQLMLMVQALRHEEDPAPLVWLAIALPVAGFAHIALAQTGWMERYEHYLIVSLMLAIAIVAGFSGRWFRWTSVLAILAMIAVGQFFVQRIPDTYTWASRAINAQQAQMARFAKDYLKRNVAVNDLGEVSWDNPNYVLDLWGLANNEARHIRLYDPTPGWAGKLADAHDVSVIMIYDKWLKEAEDPNWVPLGKLILLHPRGYLGDIKVSFYARNHQEAAYAEAALLEWKKTLVKDTCFVPMETTIVTECPQ